MSHSDVLVVLLVEWTRDELFANAMGDVHAHTRLEIHPLAHVHSSRDSSIDPGSASEDVGSAHRFISATVTLCGIFITSTLIGALTTGMEGKIAELRKGRTKVIETDHTSKRSLASIGAPPHVCRSNA